MSSCIIAFVSIWAATIRTANSLCSLAATPRKCKHTTVNGTISTVILATRTITLVSLHFRRSFRHWWQLWMRCWLYKDNLVNGLCSIVVLLFARAASNEYNQQSECKQWQLHLYGFYAMLVRSEDREAGGEHRLKWSKFMGFSKALKLCKSAQLCRIFDSE